MPSSSTHHDESGVRLTIDGDVATITVDRQQVRNALNADAWRRLRQLLDEAGGSYPRVRVLLLRGAGDKAFVAGADIAELMELAATPEGRTTYIQLVESVMSAVETLPQPVIAVVSGDAVGAGLELMAAADLRIARAGVWIGIPAAKLGLAVTGQDLRRLERLVGVGRTKWLLMTGRLVDAETAFTLGLVDAVHPPEALEDAVAALARDVASNSALTHRLTKQALTALRDGEAENVGFERALPAWSSASLREGVAAFLQRRPANFRAVEQEETT